MGSKKKSKKSCWLEMEKDEYVLEALHQKDCSNSFRDISNSSNALFPRISNKVFCGEVALRKPKDLQFPEHVIEDVIEAHPDTMMLCGMKISDPVLVVHETCAFACRVWPSTRLQLGKVSLSENKLSNVGIEVGSFVRMTPPPLGVMNASTVTLSPLTSYDDAILPLLYSSNHFLNYVSNYLDKTFVVIGQQVELFYFGRRLAFRVTDAESEGKSEGKSRLDGDISNSFNDSANITKNLSFLSLKNDYKLRSSVNPSDSAVMTSTPLKDTPHPKTDGISVKIPDNVGESQHTTMCNKVYRLLSHTRILMNDDKTESNIRPTAKTLPVITFKDIGGLKKQIDILKDLVLLPAQNPSTYDSAGILSVHGVLLHGVSGTGKSLLAKALAGEVGGCTKTVSASEVISRYFGESEEKLRSVFTEARSRSPCVVIMDEVDALCPRRDSARTDAEKRLVATFTSILDDINNNPGDGHVVVVATTNRIEAVDPALRRAGRFDREIEVPIPSARERAEIFEKILSKTSNSVTREELDVLSEKCHGYVGADLLAVCKEAGLSAVKACQGTSQVVITLPHLEYGLKQVAPSAMRELIVQVPKVHWTDIGGNETVKRKLRHAIEWPLQKPESFKRLGIDPPRGVLLYGPPGCSKTLTAKALATESGLNFISIKGPELFSKYVGDSERAIRQVFAKARSAAPSIVFFDELDAVAIERGSGNAVADRVLATLLTEMDGVEQRSDVIVVAATNRPDMIDKAFLRPGRIDRILYVPLPDWTTRKEIFKIRFRKIPISSDVDLDELVQRTEMYSGAEICSVCREAALAALDDDLKAEEVGSKHFDSALGAVLPQTTKERAKLYANYEETLQTRIK